MNNVSFSEDSNKTSFSNVSHHENRPDVPMIVLITILTFDALAVILNIILLLVMAIHRPLRSSSSCILIVNCLAIDLYVALIPVPIIGVPFYLGHHWRPSHNFCRYQSFYVFFAYGAGAYAEQVLAIHRLVGSVFPLYYSKLTTRKALIFLVIYPYAACFLPLLFPALEIFAHVTPLDSGGCFVAPLPGGSNAFILYVFKLLGLEVPLATTFICYSTVLIKAYLDSRKSVTSNSSRRRVEISRTLFISSIWHAVALYPYTMILVDYRDLYQSPGSVTLRICLNFLACSFNFVNPIFFWASSKMFQDGIKEVLRCRWQFTSRTVGPSHITCPAAIEDKSAAMRLAESGV